MLKWQLDRRDEARATLAQLRALMADPANAETWAKDDEAKTLLNEAEELIEGPAAATQPSTGPGGTARE